MTITTGTLHEDQHTLLNTSRSILLRMRNVSDKSSRENQNTHFVLNNLFPKIVPFVCKWGKTFQCERSHTWQYGTCAFHAGYLRLHTHTQNMQDSLHFYCDNGSANSHQRYIMRTMPTLFNFKASVNSGLFPVWHKLHFLLTFGLIFGLKEHGAQHCTDCIFM
jgi:hypothetical protein